MLFSPSRAKTTWTPPRQAPTSPSPPAQRTSLCPAWQPPPSLQPSPSLRPISQTSTTQKSPSWLCWAYRCCSQDSQPSWQCAGALNRTGTLRPAAAQGRVWPADEAGQVNPSLRCGRDWAHIGVHTTCLLDDRLHADHRSVRTHMCPGLPQDRHHRQKPVWSPTSQCHVCLTMSLRSDLRTGWGLTLCSQKCDTLYVLWFYGLWYKKRGLWIHFKILRLLGGWSLVQNKILSSQLYTLVTTPFNYKHQDKHWKDHRVSLTALDYIWSDLIKSK